MGLVALASVIQLFELLASVSAVTCSLHARVPAITCTTRADLLASLHVWAGTSGFAESMQFMLQTASSTQDTNRDVSCGEGSRGMRRQPVYRNRLQQQQQELHRSGHRLWYLYV